MILIYRTLTNFLYPFLIVLILFRKLINKEDKNRYKEKIFPSFFYIKKNNNKKLIWFHAASIGEFKSVLPIIKELNQNNSHFEFLITTVTLSSSNLAKEELKKIYNAYHRFFPLDVNFLIKKFLYLWKPYAIFLVDSEIWPNLISNSKELKIPLAIINARITKKTFIRWMCLEFMAKNIFKSFDICLTSNLETKKYLEKLHAKNIFYTGNIKLIGNIDKKVIHNPNKEILEKNRFWFAASTHKGEEEFCLKTHLILKKKYEKIITVIAPRHIERINKIKKLCDKLNLKSQVLNKNDLILENKEIILINSFGVLSSFFKYAKSVFIGKSLIKKLEKVGGQNPIDAAKLGCKIYHGPFVYNFEEIYKTLKQYNISQKIENSDELAAHLLTDLINIKNNSNEFSILMNNLARKTLHDTMKNIKIFLSNETY